MNIRRVLTTLIREVVEEAEHNPAFKARLHSALGSVEDTPKIATSAKPLKVRGPSGTAATKRPSNRRASAALDPISLARQSEAMLRAELDRLDLEQLRDIVAEYGMDTGKLVMKWRTSDRIVDRIVEVAMARAQKGSAFRDQVAEETAPDKSESN